VLVEVARDETTIAYSELIEETHAIALEVYDIRLNHLLDQLSRDEHRAGRGVLSVVMVHKGAPALWAGFFECAEQLGYE
jgi:hypothetical protein